MKKVIIVSILVIAMICSLTTAVRATGAVDIGEFPEIEDNPQGEQQTPPVEEEQQTPPPAEEEQQQTPPVQDTSKKEETPVADNSVATTKNPQTGIKEEAPIIIVTILG